MRTHSHTHTCARGLEGIRVQSVDNRPEEHCPALLHNVWRLDDRSLRFVRDAALLMSGNDRRRAGVMMRRMKDAVAAELVKAQGSLIREFNRLNRVATPRGVSVQMVTRGLVAERHSQC